MVVRAMTTFFLQKYGNDVTRMLTTSRKYVSCRILSNLFWHEPSIVTSSWRFFITLKYSECTKDQMYRHFIFDYTASIFFWTELVIGIWWRPRGWRPWRDPCWRGWVRTCWFYRFAASRRASLSRGIRTCPDWVQWTKTFRSIKKISVCQLIIYFLGSKKTGRVN